jgi:hypothetical protein
VLNVEELSTYRFGANEYNGSAVEHSEVPTIFGSNEEATGLPYSTKSKSGIWSDHQSFVREITNFYPSRSHAGNYYNSD